MLLLRVIPQMAETDKTGELTTDDSALLAPSTPFKPWHLANHDELFAPPTPEWMEEMRKKFPSQLIGATLLSEMFCAQLSRLMENFNAAMKKHDTLVSSYQSRPMEMVMFTNTLHFILMRTIRSLGTIRAGLDGLLDTNTEFERALSSESDMPPGQSRDSDSDSDSGTESDDEPVTSPVTIPPPPLSIPSREQDIDDFVEDIRKCLREVLGPRQDDSFFTFIK